MKIGCDACERAEAAVLCCADEAALCRSCDAAVHSANKLAGRHHRVALLPSSSTAHSLNDGSGEGHPGCDICQEKTGYFFCLEDRALLCRPCDVAVHTAGAHVSSHRRFLITGVRVGDVETHHVLPGSDDCGSGSPSTSSAPCSSGDPMTMTAMPDDKVWRPSASVHATAAATSEGLDGQQWLWSEFLAGDVGVGGVGVGVAMDMEQSCHAELCEPGSSSSLTRC